MLLFIKILLAALALFIPFAFGGAEPWAFSVLQVGIVTCAVLWLLSSHQSLGLSKAAKPFVFTLIFLVLLGLVQSCFPRTLLDAHVLYPVTFMRWFTLETLSLFITYGALVLLLMQLFQSQDEIRPMLYWLVCCALAVAICAVCFTRGEYIFFLAGVRGGVGPFLNRNHAAIFFAMNALITLGLIFANATRPERHQMHREQRQRFQVQQLCGWLVFAGLCGAVIFTRSRGGMLSLGVGLFSFAFLAVWFLPRSRKKRLLGLVLTAAVLAGTLLWVGDHISQINRYARRVKKDGSVSAHVRRTLDETGLRILADYPVWGTGIGAMPVTLPPYLKVHIPNYVEHLHNDWLELALGVGCAGIIPVALALLYFFWVVLRRMRHLPRHKFPIFAAAFCGMITMGTGSLVDFHFFIPANAFVFSVLLAVVCAFTYDKHRLSWYRLPFVLRAVLAAVLLLSLYVPARKAVAWRGMQFGRSLKPAAQTARYQQALSYYPVPRYAARLANAYIRQANFTDNPAERKRLLNQAFNLSKIYLQRYPKDPALSRVYVRTRDAQ